MINRICAFVDQGFDDQLSRFTLSAGISFKEELGQTGKRVYVLDGQRSASVGYSPDQSEVVEVARRIMNDAGFGFSEISSGSFSLERPKIYSLSVENFVSRLHSDPQCLGMVGLGVEVGQAFSRVEVRPIIFRRPLDCLNCGERSLVDLYK